MGLRPRANLLFQEVGSIETEVGDLGKENADKGIEKGLFRCDAATG